MTPVDCVDFPQTGGHPYTLNQSIGERAMTNARFTEEFKEEAIKQVLERGYAVPDVAKRLMIKLLSRFIMVLRTFF